MRAHHLQNMGHRIIAVVVALLLSWAGAVTPVQARLIAAASTDSVERLGPQQDPSAQQRESAPADDRMPDDVAGVPAGDDGAPDMPALLMPSPAVSASSLTMAKPRPTAPAIWAEPDLSGPRRPPKATTSVA